MSKKSRSSKDILERAFKEHNINYQIKKVDPGVFEIWKGLQYVCMLSFCRGNRKWAATHNTVHSKASDFPWECPVDAMKRYEARRPIS